MRLRNQLASLARTLLIQSDDEHVRDRFDRHAEAGLARGRWPGGVPYRGREREDVRTGLRLGAIGVIAILALSLTREYQASGRCLRESISAYYYTPVQSVFSGRCSPSGS